MRFPDVGFRTGNENKEQMAHLGGAVVVVGLFVAFSLNHNNAPQHFTAKVDKGEIHDVVDATGMINAVITVQVGSQVSGTISKLYVDSTRACTKATLWH